ncbi:MAG: DUF2249 domain-containing protein [Haloferacaceae archaeon]
MGRITVPEDARELDVRQIDGEPYGPIMAALEELSDDETLVLHNDFEPEPLYAQLERLGFDYRTRQVEPDLWQVLVERA